MPQQKSKIFIYVVQPHILKNHVPGPVKVTYSRLTLCNPMDCEQPFPSPGDLPNPGIEPRSPALQVDSLAVEPQGKPKNTRVGSLSLLQGIFPTQESNWGFLHCRQILYQLTYQESPQQDQVEFNPRDTRLVHYSKINQSNPTY